MLEHVYIDRNTHTHTQVHAEIFATELAANVYGLVKGVEGIDYSTGDVKLTIDGTEKESLRNLKEKLIQSLITERDKTETLVRYASLSLSLSLSHTHTHTHTILTSTHITRFKNSQIQL